MELIEDIWQGCYREGWKGLIVPEAFAHPAKYSRALIRTIYQHVIEEDWAVKGDSVVDPFGGVALGGFDALQLGLNWTGCELEAKFVGLGNQNIALWNERFSRMPNWGTARLIQGDSRKLIEVIAGADLTVSSPPYAGKTDGQLAEMPQGNVNLAVSSPPFSQPETRDRAPVQDGSVSDFMNRAYTVDRQGTSEGNVAALPQSDEGFSAAISSPPYASIRQDGCGIAAEVKDNKGFRSYSGEPVGAWPTQRDQDNLGNMPDRDRDFQAAVSSPPYEAQFATNAGGNMRCSSGPMGGDPKNWTKNRTKEQLQADKERAVYSEADDNLGNQRGEDFWSASRIILEQLFQVIVPGGHAVFVVKAFVRNKKIVDFPGQWAQLCEAVGFKLVHHHRASLVELGYEQSTLEGDIEQKRVERKSFFRRLAESKGSPRIDHESVLCFIKEPR